MSSYFEHTSTNLIFTEAKLKINATNLFFLITVTIAATIQTLASQNHLPPSCAHKTQTLIILKISNTIQFPSNGHPWNTGGGMRRPWGLFSSNQPLDTSASEVKHSWQAIALPTEQHNLQDAALLPTSAPFPNKSPRRDTVNLFSQQRAPEVRKKIVNLPIGKTPRHYHN